MDDILIFSTIVVIVAILLSSFSDNVKESKCAYCADTSHLHETYDFIVIGGGTAGSIIAAELSQDENFSVLLIEAGGPTHTAFHSEQSVPGLETQNVIHGKIDAGLKLEPQIAPLSGTVPIGFKERRVPIPRGKVLGGSNELNYMLHVEATAGDFDNWADLVSDANWNSRGMASAVDAYALRADEKMFSAGAVAGKENRTNTRVSVDAKGKVVVGPNSRPLALSNDWVAACGSADYGNMSHCNDGPRRGGCHFEHTVSNGLRHSTARAFLLPVAEDRKHTNLHVLVNAQVTKIVITQGRAKAVQFSHGNVDGITISANKEVILSAGAYSSPHLLMLSGVGPIDHLRAMGVTVKVHRPGVGAHLQDHPMFPVKVRFGPEGGSWWPTTLTQLNVLGNPLNLWNFVVHGTGPLATSGIDVSFFHASNETYTNRPDYQTHVLLTAGNRALFEHSFQYRPGTFVDNVGTGGDYGPFAQGVIFAPTLLHPQAQGSVRLRSGDPFAPPIIRYEMLEHEADVRRLVDQVRVLQKILAQPEMQAHQPQILYHKGLVQEFGEDTDEYWREYIKRFAGLCYHPTGTAKMGRSGDPGAVVDTRLRVIGLRGLRVADASVMPEITSGNTNAPTAAIALKLVELLRAEHGVGQGGASAPSSATSR